MLEFCPLCDKNGSKRRIKLSQLNLEEAVWICESSECPWPFGYEDFTFVSRKIGETWSSEWDLRRPPTSKPSEPRQISLNELGLDTPPVTPGSGSEVIQKDSMFVENTCSATSPSLSPDSLVRTKGTRPGPGTSFNKFGRSYNSECGSPGTRISGENQVLVPLGANRGIEKEKTQPEFKSDFSLVDDLNFETLDKCLSSSQRFSEACDAAEALTESVFNVGKSSKDKLSGLYDNGDCHESTVKCKKWLSDNTKGTVLGDHCYSSPESSGIGSRLKRGSTESLNNKKLPRVKSIKKANVKLLGALARSNSTCSEEGNSPSFTSTSKVDDLDKNVEDKGNTIPTMEGSLPTSLSDEVPGFVEACVTVPWSTECGDVKSETIVKIDPKPEPAVDDNPVVLIKIKAGDLESIRGTRIVQTSMNLNTQARSKPDHRLRKIKSEPVVDNKSMISIGIKPEDSGDARLPKIIRSALNTNAIPRNEPDHKSRGRNRNTECRYEVTDKMEEPRLKPLVNLVDIQEMKNAEKPTSNDKIELQRNSMKKPQKRALPKNAKYQGFNFGSLKKKSKGNLSSSEESIKSSLPDLPSPDTASTCSDVTWGSECSYTTACTVDSKFDSHSKSSLGVEDASSASSSDVKSSSNMSAPEADSVSDANLSLDLQVLDELMLCDDVDLPQGFADDWLVSLFD